MELTDYDKMVLNYCFEATLDDTKRKATAGFIEKAEAEMIEKDIRNLKKKIN